MDNLIRFKTEQSILVIRGMKVILDFQLAKLYCTETRTLKQQVKRNLDRFPIDFMFELSESEIDWLVSQNVIPEKKVLGGAQPMAFTEQFHVVFRAMKSLIEVKSKPRRQIGFTRDEK